VSVSIPALQRALAETGDDGWLFYLFQNNDPIASRVLQMNPGHFLTRRCFYFVPRRGAPVKIVHRIETDALEHLPGRRLVYLSWRDLEGRLAEILKGLRVAMQYSPKNAVPYLSRVDAGTVELVRAAGARVTSSGDLVQIFEARLTPAQWRDHQRSAAKLRAIVFEAFGFIARKTRRRETVGEYEVQRKIRAAYGRMGLVTSADPIVAVNANSGRPHYTPRRNKSRRIKKGDWVLLDIWAKSKAHESVYADITWCGFVGERVPERHENIFQIVRQARDKALDFVRASWQKAKSPQGWEVDRAARAHIASKGYGKYFIHRTGHSIGTEDHGNGAHMDGLETRETRRLLPGLLFSIEPGIYLKDFGARSEINVFLDGRTVRVSGEPVQERAVPLLRR